MIACVIYGIDELLNLCDLIEDDIAKKVETNNKEESNVVDKQGKSESFQITTFHRKYLLTKKLLMFWRVTHRNL